MNFHDHMPELLAEELITCAGECRMATKIALGSTTEKLEPGARYSDQMRSRSVLRGDQAVSAAYMSRALDAGLTAVAESMARDYMSKLAELRALHTAIAQCQFKISKKQALPPPLPDPPDEFRTLDACSPSGDRDKGKLQREVEQDFEAFVESFDLPHDYLLPVTECRDGSFKPVAQRR